MFCDKQSNKLLNVQYKIKMATYVAFETLWCQNRLLKKLAEYIHNNSEGLDTK